MTAKPTVHSHEGDVASPLIDVATLRRLLDKDVQLSLLDVRASVTGDGRHEEYLDAHLPGAVWVDLNTDLSTTPGAGGRHPLPPAADAESTFSRLGVDRDHLVVVYDDLGGVIAARAWWLLRWLGHPDVRLLDGGLPAWAAAGLPLEPGEVTPKPAEFTAERDAMPVLDARGAATVASQGVLLDARAGERFRGETEPLDPVAGHIPGARSMPARDTIDATGRLLPPAQLRQRFTSAGVSDQVAVGAYCGSGVTASHIVLALEVAGFPGAALYAGSWSEWISDPGRPVATGD
jgi:thiosulfate/3-mercaptopyruvate sulfurtransferase